MTNTQIPISQITKLTPKQQKALKQMGILSVSDLLLYFPRRHIDFSLFSQISELKTDTTVTIFGEIKSIQKKFSFKTKKNLTEAIISDQTGFINVTWFNQGYIASMYKPGEKIALAGKVTYYNKLQLVNPVHERVTTEQIHTGRLVPLYKLPEILYDRTFRNLVQKALPYTETLEEILPEFILNQFNLPNIKETAIQMHFPTNLEMVQLAKTRLAFTEILIEQLAVGLHKKQLEALPSFTIKKKENYVEKVINQLPFKLTKSQKISLQETLEDLEIKKPMNRLLEGDVGSGKTLIAQLSMLHTANQNYQTLLLAPTEILATQHYSNTLKLLSEIKNKKFTLALLTGSQSLINQTKIKPIELKKIISEGKANLIIGTHALLTEPEIFKNLALLVVDEQHRFGVKQRSLLIKPKNKKSPVPHLLSMSATPIPRTLALTYYDDLDISTLTELPTGRKKIKTYLVPENKRKGAYDFIRKHIKDGRQAFIVTPLVEESDKLQIKSAKTEFEKLKTTIFPDLKLDLIYGGLKGKEKDRIMKEFHDKKLDILVATSVVEVGIDIKNANIIVIEGAERFGLSTLHQLRGRVGRGEHESYCLLFASENTNTSNERLQKFSTIENGFELAEQDLQTRGFGSLFGLEQSGFKFKFSEFITITTLKMAKEASKEILKKSSNLSHFPKLKKLATPLLKDIHLE